MNKPILRNDVEKHEVIEPGYYFYKLNPEWPWTFVHVKKNENGELWCRGLPLSKSSNPNFICKGLFVGPIEPPE